MTTLDGPHVLRCFWIEGSMWEDIKVAAFRSGKSVNDLLVEMIRAGSAEWKKNPPMTEHPAAGCTKRQIEVFEQIATGNHKGHNPRVLSALAAKGLIQFNTRTVGRDVLGLITIQEPFVPLPTHYQFCQWASEQDPEDDPDTAFDRDINT